MLHKKLYILLFSILCIQPNLAVTPYKIAYIDSARILEEYSEAKKLLVEIAEAEKQLNQKIIAKRQEIEKAKAQKKTETEIQMMAEKIRLELEPEAKKIEEDSARKSKIIEDKVDQIIKDYAAKNKYDIVMIKEAVLNGGVDITNDILKLLK